MKLSQFKFELPENLIAQHPADNRDESFDGDSQRQRKIEHKMFKDVLDYFDGEMWWYSITPRFSARLYGNKEKTGATIEVFCWSWTVRAYCGTFWWIRRKDQIGNKLYFGENDELVAEVIDNTTSERTLRFLFDGTHDEFKTVYKLHQTPLQSTSTVK